MRSRSGIPPICIDCAKCALVCPHAAIRMKVFEPGEADGAPATFQHKEWKDRERPGRRMTIQVAPDDCTGCGICVDVCPARSKEQVKHKAIDMCPKLDHLDDERANWDFFTSIADPDPATVRAETVKGSQQLPPLFEFSGACAGCGETPYLKLLTQLVGDRLLVANATGCSSIYGGNLPTTPWSVGADGRGPAWSNSLFEDNAEFGLGMRLGRRRPAAAGARAARDARGRPRVSRSCAGSSRASESRDREAIARQRLRVDELRARLQHVHRPGGPRPRGDRRCADAHERVDRRRRRVGLRHRLRWARPRARERTQRERARARHRGLLEHRRPGLEGHASRRRRQVRRGRQGPGQEGPRHDRDRVRRRVRRPDRDGRRHAAHGEGARRGRGPPWPLARDRLQPLHRARHRHVDRDDASARRGRDRVLAAVAVRAGGGRARRAPVPSRLEAAVAPPVGVRVEGGTVRDARALRSGSRRGAADGSRRTTSTPGGVSTNSSRRSTGDPTNRPTRRRSATHRRWRTREPGPAHHRTSASSSRTRWCRAPRRWVNASRRSGRSRMRAPPPSCCRRCSRNRSSTTRSSSRARSRPAPRATRRRSRTCPSSPTTRPAPTPTCGTSRPPSVSSRSP